MIAVTVTIGRNRRPGSEIAPNRAMSAALWHTFRNTVRKTLEVRAGGEHWTEVHEGRAVWDGVPEESAKITVLAEHFDDNGLRDALADLAFVFDQDAIALCVAPSALIFQRVPAPNVKGSVAA